MLCTYNILLSYYYYNFCNFSFFGGSYILLLLCFSKTARYLDVASLTSLLLLPFVCFCPAIQSWLFCFDQWIMTTIKMLQPVAKKNRQQILRTTEQHIIIPHIWHPLYAFSTTTLCMCNCICSDFVYIIITTKRGYIASWPETTREGGSRSVTLGNSL